MKLSPEAKKFLGKNVGDRVLRQIIKKGGRTNAVSDFNEILKRASKPSPSQRKARVQG